MASQSAKKELLEETLHPEGSEEEVDKEWEEFTRLMAKLKENRRNRPHRYISADPPWISLGLVIGSRNETGEHTPYYFTRCITFEKLNRNCYLILLILISRNNNNTAGDVTEANEI